MTDGSKGMAIETPAALTRLAEAAAARGERIWFVGGSVRNALLGLPASDLDITGKLLHAEVQALCDGLGIKCVQMDTFLGTLHINLGNGIIAEYTPFRTERYAPGGAHRPESVFFGVSMEEDALRRDFTVNALYRDVLTGELADPLGGAADVERKLLRACSRDTLSSDALRILRLIRFSAELGFSVAPETEEDARRNAALLDDIVPERKREELEKILIADAKYGGGTVSVTSENIPVTFGEAENVFNALMRMDALGVWEHLIPELTEGRGEEQNKLYHKYTVQEHIFRTVAAAPRDPLIRLTMLLHDVAKPYTFRRDGNYHLHNVNGVPMAARILDGLRFPVKTRETVTALVKAHMLDTAKNAKESTLRKHFAALGRENTARLIAVRESDVHGCGTEDDFVAVKFRELFATMLTDGTPFSERELAIGGKGIMEATHLPAGTAIGAVKAELHAHCVHRPQDNTPERLAALAPRTEAARRALKGLAPKAD
ncbi:MAG: hypothetical protein Q4C53_05450 [Clostridia bacterium]|nr:hypothetical protein [Clostridia bacterium]